MILFDNRVDTVIDDEILKFLETIANNLTSRDIELLFVSNNEIRALNVEFLGKDYVTDVLSFPLDFNEFMSKSCNSYSSLNSLQLPLGSIVIAFEIADSVAKAQNHSLRDELAILFTHGLLHLLGYDHESDNGEHRQKECEILARFGIESTLISRNS